MPQAGPWLSPGLRGRPPSGSSRSRFASTTSRGSEARLGEQYVGTTWRQWVFDWDAAPGEHRIQVRATDGNGDTQTERRTEVAPDGATGWHTISVTAT